MSSDPLRIGIYAPYLNISGGGEKFIGKIAEFLSQRHRVDFLTIEPVNLKRIQERLHLDLSQVNVVSTSGMHPQKSSYFSELIRKWKQIRTISNISQSYDLFLNQETLTVIPNCAKRGIVICQIPPQTFNPSTSLLSNLARISGANLFFDPKLKSYEKIIVYSQFVASIAQDFYHKPTFVLYPPVDTEQFEPLPKQNLILSVGRFFVGVHNKKQLEMIRIFKSIYDQGDPYQKLEYHLVGGIDPDEQAKQYAQRCQQEAQGYPIVFHFNAPFAELRTLYGRAKLFWHGAGMNEDENRHPERVEHFGISTVEAMAAGCVPLVINKGGQPEIVRHQVDGLCWNTPEDLCHYTQDLIHDEAICGQMSLSSQIRSREFNIATFEKALLRMLDA